MDFSENTAMCFLIPTMQGNGLIPIALLDHLIWTHNCAVEICRKFVETTLARYSILCLCSLLPCKDIVIWKIFINFLVKEMCTTCLAHATLD